MDDINTYLTVGSPRTAEKGLYGEVFTPVSVVDSMLAMLPAAVWRNPNARWCDPACGIGHFPLKAIFGGPGYPGLLTGLASHFDSRAAAFAHILENMMWCYDINSEHTVMLRGKLRKLGSDLGVAASSHIVTGDFLAANDGPFDVIMGNPPYNSGGIKRVGEKRLHVRFAEAALAQLTVSGHLLFVCPPNYREAGSSMNALFRAQDGGFRSVWMIGPNETHRLFKVQTRVDCFLWSRGFKGETHVVDELSHTCHVRLDLERHIPNFGFSVFQKLRARDSASINAFRSAEATTISCEKSGFRRDGGGRYPTLHLIVEEGRKVLRRNRPHTLQSTPKIILNGLGIPYVFYDKAGKYGVTQTPVVILDPPAQLVAFIKSPLFYFIVWGLRITGNNNLPYLFQDVPAGYGEGIKFTAEERELIATFRVPDFADRDNYIVCSSGRRSTRRRK
jgi:hypothetical protein